MRKHITLLVILPLAFLVIGSAQLLAQGPQGTACDGEPWTIVGDVTAVQAGGPGGLTVVDSDDAEVSIFGIGPVWYWRQSGVDFPEVGDHVSVTVSNVKCMDDPVLLTYVRLEGEGGSLDLRNDLCYPLWMRPGK